MKFSLEYCVSLGYVTNCSFLKMGALCSWFVLFVIILMLSFGVMWFFLCLSNLKNLVQTVCCYLWMVILAFICKFTSISLEFRYSVFCCFINLTMQISLFHLYLFKYSISAYFLHFIVISRYISLFFTEWWTYQGWGGGGVDGFRDLTLFLYRMERGLM